MHTWKSQLPVFFNCVFKLFFFRLKKLLKLVKSIEKSFKGLKIDHSVPIRIDIKRSFQFNLIVFLNRDNFQEYKKSLNPFPLQTKKNNPADDLPLFISTFYPLWLVPLSVVMVTMFQNNKLCRLFIWIYTNVVIKE